MLSFVTMFVVELWALAIVNFLYLKVGRRPGRMTTYEIEIEIVQCTCIPYFDKIR